MRGLRVRGAIVALGLSGFLLGQDGPARPLPDPRVFLEDVRRNIRSDGFLLDQYTFTEEFTERRLDAKGRVKKSRSETYEVYPSYEPGKLYRRLVARNGKRLSETELAEQDRKQEERTAKRERRRSSEDEAARRKQLARKEERRREEQRVVEEVFLMDEIVVVGRETIDGRSTVIVDFTPKPGYRPITEGGKVIQKIQGRAWIDEEDRQLVRIETRLLDNMGVGPARVARLQRGSSGYFQRRKVNGEIWLPAEASFRGEAKLLLVFGARVEISSRYTDYRKFSVGTEEEVVTEKGTN
ncbi:MAG: hypothetical protein WEB59_14095 [Thermoanaerobaculia bacterium]